MATQPIDYAALAKKAGAVQSAAPAIDYDALAKQAGAIDTGASTDAAPPRGFLSNVINSGTNFANSAVQTVVPVKSNQEFVEGLTKGVPYAVQHPVDSASLIENAGDSAEQQLIDKAYTLQHSPGIGNKIKGLAYGMYSLIPGGTALANAGEKFERGDISGGAGTTTGVAAQLFGGSPEVQSIAPKVSQTVSTLAKPAFKAAGGAIADVPVLRGVVKGMKTFGEVPGQLKSIWSPAPNPSASIVNEPVPEEAAPFVQQPSPAPYRMSGKQIVDAATVTPTKPFKPYGLLSSGESETAPAAQPAEPSPAPYRLSGKQIIDATTVTPKKPFSPYGLLSGDTQVAPASAGQNPIPQEAAQYLKPDPAKAQVQLFKKMGVAAPSATVKPLKAVPSASLDPLPNQAFPGIDNGTDAAMHQLAARGNYGINDLRAIAVQRGIKVEPGDTHIDLMNKIRDSLSPQEVQKFQDAAAAQNGQRAAAGVPQNQPLAQNLYSAANELAKTKGNPYEITALRSAARTIEDYPQNIADVDLSKTKIPGIDVKIKKRINDFLGQQQQSNGAQPSAAAQAPQQPQAVTNSSDLTGLLEQSIDAAKAAKANGGKASLFGTQQQPSSVFSNTETMPKYGNYIDDSLAEEIRNEEYFLRLHPHDSPPISPENAKSTPWGADEEFAKEQTRDGYSSFSNPDRFLEYHKGEPDSHRVGVFSGKIIGKGEDGEPLAFPNNKTIRYTTLGEIRRVAKEDGGQVYKSPKYAYRVRDVGESGIRPTAEGHAEAGLDQSQIASYMTTRNPGTPQELVKIDLSQLDPSEYTLENRNGMQWVKFRTPVPESFIEKISKSSKIQ